MPTDWLEVAKALGPLGGALIAVLGIGFGARLSRRATTNSFLRERIFAEMEKRREVAIGYRKELWVFAARVRALRRLAEEAKGAVSEGRKPGVKYDFPGAQAAHITLLEKFAELEMRATTAVQVPARDCMEALASAFNYLTALRLDEAAASLAFFTQRYEDLSVELNKESDHFNAIIYSSFTSVWRAILGKARWQPLPYKVLPPPIELRNTEEKVVRIPLDTDSNSPN